MQVRLPPGGSPFPGSRREAHLEMKLLSAAGLLICASAATVGIAMGGMNGMLIVLAALLAGVILLLQFLKPSGWGEAPVRPGRDERAFLAKMVLTGFLLRAAASVLLHLGAGWSYFGGDEGTFGASAEVFSLWVQGKLSFNMSVALGAKAEVAYPYLLGALYYTFGVSKFVPLLLNCVVGASIVYPVHALAGRFAGREAARRAAFIVTWFPSLVLWSALMVRDCWVLLFIISALFFAERARRSLTPANLLGVALCLAGIATTRNYVYSVVGIGLAAGFVLGRRAGSRAALVGCLAVVGIVLFMRDGGGGVGAGGGETLETIARYRRLNAMGPSVAGSLGDVDISTPTAALSYLPLGLLYFFFSPFPWQIGSSKQVIALVDLLFWYSLVPSMMFGGLWLFRHRFRSLASLLFVVVGISVLYGLVEGNIGIIFRHRAQIIVPLCAVAGAGYALKRRAARKEARLLENPVPVHSAPLGPFGPPPDLRLPARA